MEESEKYLLGKTRRSCYESEREEKEEKEEDSLANHGGFGAIVGHRDTSGN